MVCHIVHVCHYDMISFPSLRSLLSFECPLKLAENRITDTGITMVDITRVVDISEIDITGVQLSDILTEMARLIVTCNGEFGGSLSGL